MKKLMLLVATICAAFSVSAQSLSYEGDISMLKSVFAYDVEYNYDGLQVNGTELQEFLASMDDKFRAAWGPEIVTFSEAYGKAMPIAINKKNTLDPANAKYILVMNLDSLTLGNVSGMFNPFASSKSGGSIISGHIDILDAASRESLCVITFNEIQGLSNISDKTRWGLAYYELGKQIKKMVKKAK